MDNININANEQLIYLRHLINRIYKILPLAEDNNNVVPKLYVKKLIKDIKSANDMFNGILVNLLVRVNILLDENLVHSDIRSTIFECINLCKKIIENLEE